MSAAFNKIKKVDRSKLEGNALKAYDTLKEETDNFDKDVAVALNLDDDVERLAKKLEEKFPESVGKKKAEKAKPKAKKKAAKKKSTPKGGSGNKGSFAKLRASIAKREGISYKAALPIAKKEYAEQKKKDSDSKKEKRNKRMEAFKRKYKGRGTRNTDVQKDSKIPAKAVGKRVSKTGNTYYEYRDNRTDQRQPQPTNEPRLDVGGMIKREYDVNINSGVGTYAKGGKVDNKLNMKILVALRGSNKGYMMNSLLENMGLSNYRFNQYATAQEREEVENALEYLIKIGYVEKDGSYYKQTQKGREWERENYLKYAKGGEVDAKEIGMTQKLKMVEEEARSIEPYPRNDKEAERAYRIAYKRVMGEEMLAKGGKTDGDWIQGAVEEMEKKGTIGTFTKKAEKRGMTPIEFASEVLDSTNKNKFTEKTRKQAQFVKNANPELFAFGGEIVRDYDVNINSGVGTYAKGGDVKQECGLTKDQVEKLIKGLNSNISYANQSIKAEKSDKERVAGLRYEIMAYEAVIGSLEFYSQKNMAQGGDIMQDISPNANDGDGDIMPDASSMVNYAKGGKVSKAQLESELSNNLRNLRDLNESYSRTGNEVFFKQQRPLVERNEEIVGELKSRDPKFDITKYAQGGDILKAGDTDCPDELLNYAVGGRLNETMQGLKKGDTLKIKFGSAVSKDNVVTLRVKSRNKVRKGTIDKITFENLSNPKGVKFFAYDRGDGFSFAMGDLGISNVEILNKYKEGGKTQGYNAQLDESLGDRTGREDLFEQKKKDRRDESKAMEEAMNRRAYASVQQMDKKKRRK